MTRLVVHVYGTSVGTKFPGVAQEGGTKAAAVTPLQHMKQSLPRKDTLINRVLKKRPFLTQQKGKMFSLSNRCSLTVTSLQLSVKLLVTTAFEWPPEIRLAVQIKNLFWLELPPHCWF